MAKKLLILEKIIPRRFLSIPPRLGRRQISSGTLTFSSSSASATQKNLSFIGMHQDRRFAVDGIRYRPWTDKWRMDWHCSNDIGHLHISYESIIWDITLDQKTGTELTTRMNRGKVFQSLEPKLLTCSKAV